MYFIPVRNRLYSFGINVPAWQRYAMTLGCLFMLVAVWYFVLFMPLVGAFSSVERELIQLEDKQKVALITNNALQEATKSYNDKQKEFLRLSDVALPGLSLLELVQKNGLPLTSYAPQAVQDYGWYTEAKTSCSLMGTFQQVVSFFQTCATHKQPYGIATCSIAKRDGMLECMCVMQIITIKKEEQDHVTN